MQYALTHLHINSNSHFNRFKQGFSYEILAVLFKIGRASASSTYIDVLMAVFMSNKYLPTLWTASTPDDVVTEFLRAVRDQQSPAVRYIQDRIRTPDGRPVVFVLIDATDFSCENSADAFVQMDMWSGVMGKDIAYSRLRSLIQMDQC